MPCPERSASARVDAGWVASVAGGGKFFNGALSSAFGYLFSGAVQAASGDNTSSTSAGGQLGADGLLQSSAQATQVACADSSGCGVQVADAANDNFTGQQLCDSAMADCIASARRPGLSLGPGAYLGWRQQCSEALSFCTYLASEQRPYNRLGDFVEFPGGGVVIFRPDQSPKYVPPPWKQRLQ